MLLPSFGYSRHQRIVGLRDRNDLEVVAHAEAERQPLVESPLVLREDGDVVRLLGKRARPADANREAVRIGATASALLNGTLLRPNENVPFKLPWLALAAPEYWYCAPTLMSWSPCLPGQEPAERLLGLDAVVDARLRGVVLLIVEVLERQRRPGTSIRSRPLVLKQALAKATFSRVQVTRSVLTLVFDSTGLRLVDSVWSTSDSSRAAAGVSARRRR